MRLRRQQRRIESERDEDVRAFQDEIDEVKEQAQKVLAPLVDEEELLTAALKEYARPLRRGIDGKKSRDTPLGRYGWRTVNFIKAKRDVLEALLKQGITWCVRTKHSLDKEALRAHPEAAEKIPGITLGKREEFYVEPLGLEAAIR